MSVDPAGQRSVHRAAVPAWMRGLWRRRSLTYPDGRCDTTTQVYWLQTESAFADIRIHADRPDLRACGRLDALGDTDLRALARQAGFAGWTELSGDRCRWHREIDYQPASGITDEGILRRGDGVLIEEGVHEPYVEVWEANPYGTGLTETIIRHNAPAGQPRQVLVAHGDAFMYVRDRLVHMPPAPSLEALLDATAPVAARRSLLDCEISFGLRAGGALPWEIRLSTLPFLEGSRLSDRVRVPRV